MTNEISKKNQRYFLRELHAALGYKCYICKKEVSPRNITKDHVFPASFGYSISLNMMPACEACNCKKGNTPPSLDLIQLAIDTYEAVGKIFSPIVYGEGSAFDTPRNFSHATGLLPRIKSNKGVSA